MINERRKLKYIGSVFVFVTTIKKKREIINNNRNAIKKKKQNYHCSFPKIFNFAAPQVKVNKRHLSFVTGCQTFERTVMPLKIS